MEHVKGKSKDECKLNIFAMPFKTKVKFKDNFITQKIVNSFYFCVFTI